MYTGGIKITIATRANTFLVVKLVLIILLFNSCDNANNKAAESRTITENPTLSPTCQGNACDVAVWRWDKIIKKHVFKNTDENRSIIVTIDTPEVSQTFILPPNEEAASDLNSFSDPYHSNFK